MKKRIYTFEGTKIPQKIIWENNQGKIHRENDLPAVISFYETGEIDFCEWYQNGEPYRDNPNAPDFLEYYKKNHCIKKTKNRHRFKDYIFTKQYDQKGKILMRACYYKNQLHNDFGYPALVKEDENDIFIFYYHFGIDVSQYIKKFCENNKIKYGSFNKDIARLIKINWPNLF